MALFVVDADLCVSCGACVAECPSYLLEMHEGAYPTPVEWAEEDCVNCGHCVTVCPVDALALRTMGPMDCDQVQPHLLPSSEQVEHMMRARRSIRSFEATPVPKELLARLIGVASHAPTGSNIQPVEWLVVYDTDLMRRLATPMLEWLFEQSETLRRGRTSVFAREQGRDLVLRGAPHMVIAHTPPGAERQGTIALGYLELAAFAAGLGACWCGFASSPINGSNGIREMVGLPEGRVSAGVLLLGYPTYAYARVPLRKPIRLAWR